MSALEVDAQSRGREVSADVIPPPFLVQVRTMDVIYRVDKNELTGEIRLIENILPQVCPPTPSHRSQFD